MSSIESFKNQLMSWRHHLHQHPEIGFEEYQTAEFVTQILSDMGLEVTTGIGGTGLVASISRGTSHKAVAIRADMDALSICEASNERNYASQHQGKMHACGHDGHMAMVLGAAKLLTDNPDFDGTVRFLFQPAEEHGRGAKAMMADGVFERFPVDAIFGGHNMPGMPLGTIATRSGGIMASEDNFEITIQGSGTHAARPHMGNDPMVIAANIILALQTIVSRNVDPSQPAVVSCTEILTDGLRNAIPGNVVIKGDTRSYSKAIQTQLEERMRCLVKGICEAHNANGTVTYTHEFAPTVNTEEYVSLAVETAVQVVGKNNVEDNIQPMMISEDFGAFLQKIPGNFVFFGNGHQIGQGGTPLHSAHYDFNDELLVTGANYFATVAKNALHKLNRSS
ncbi:M20 aminoacylase family protein [Vibrio natriegens]|uniref:M20 aminoacylase family protein n=1 Tax=Vibrio natriegens TaxID=691 RepID=UPI00080434F2|nr:M20 aminoacylase family protein [Vibrio natriegens]ANQ29249.1 amidohydrolase [Vibrio natriegens]